MSLYKVTPCGKTYSHTIRYDSSSDKVVCSCKKYEFAGILCSHALKVFTTKNIIRILSEYIYKRGGHEKQKVGVAKLKLRLRI